MNTGKLKEYRTQSIQKYSTIWQLGLAIYSKPYRAKVNKFYRNDAKSNEIIYHYFTIA